MTSLVRLVHRVHRVTMLETTRTLSVQPNQQKKNPSAADMQHTMLDPSQQSMVDFRVRLEEETAKLDTVFRDWNHQVYHSVDLVLKNQREVYEKELDAKHQLCMELERQLGEREHRLTGMVARVDALELDVQVTKEIYKKTVVEMHEIRELVETRTAGQESLLLNRLETFRAEQVEAKQTPVVKQEGPP